jgi:uncharacterized membrane protein
MIDKLNFVLTFASALGSGLIAGFFLAFSIVVMKSLAQQPPPQGIAAMQSINIVVLNPVFFTAFFGTAAACLVLTVSTFFSWQRPGSAYLLVGSLLYLIGTILVTILFNVPRNNALAAVDPTSLEGANVWTTYLSSWTAWNHVRTIAALAAAASFTMALCQRR